MIEELEKVVKEKLTLEEQKFILAILDDIATEEIGEEKAKELREKIKGKVVDTMVMENLRDIFRMNYNEGVENGIQTATHNFIIQMLKNNISEETIKKITKVKKEELQRLKKEIKN